MNTISLTGLARAGEGDGVNDFQKQILEHRACGDAGIGEDELSVSEGLRIERDRLRIKNNIALEELRKVTAENAALRERLARTEKELAIRKSGTDRWLPCPDHRDKVDYRNACPECFHARVEAEFDVLRAEIAQIDCAAMDYDAGNAIDKASEYMEDARERLMGGGA